MQKFNEWASEMQVIRTKSFQHLFLVLQIMFQLLPLNNKNNNKIQVRTLFMIKENLAANRE